MIFSFEKEILEKLEKGTEYEWLESNQLGAYASTTIVGLNTRRRHGLLSVPYGESKKKAVVLSKLEESVFIDNQLFEISVNRFSDSIFPKGYKFIEKFELNPFPSTHFKIVDRLLTKTMFLIHNENTLVVRYELKNQGKPVKLVIKPFLAGRDSQELMTESHGLNTDSYLGQNFVRWAPKQDMPILNVHFNRGEFIPATLWYHSFYYPKDSQPGEYEDLLNPGFFQVELKPYQTFDLYISSDDINDIGRDYEKIYREQAILRNLTDKTNATYFTFSKLKDQSQQELPISLSQIGSEQSTRKYILSLPGLFLVQNDDKQKMQFINDLSEMLENGLLPTEIPVKDNRNIYKEPDTPLWLINTVYNLYLANKNQAVFSEEIVLKFKDIISAYSKGTLANIYVDKTGLVFSGDKRTYSGWFDKKDQKSKIHRHGYLLEVNALWYNALRIMEDIHLVLGKNRTANKYKKMAIKAEQSIKEKFKINKHSAFYDFIGTEYVGEDFKLNQIIPLSLPFTPGDDEFAQNVLKRVDEELLTPYGLRESGIRRVSNSEEDDHSRLLINKDSQTIVWPWTISPYVRAALKYKSDNPDLKNKLNEYFQPVFELLSKNVLGNFPEAIRLDPARDIGVPDSLLSLSNITYAYHKLIQK